MIMMARGIAFLLFMFVYMTLVAATYVSIFILCVLLALILFSPDRFWRTIPFLR